MTSRRTPPLDGIEAKPPHARGRQLLGLAAALLILIFLGLAAADGWNHVTTYDWRIQPALLASGLLAALATYVGFGAAYVLILERLAAKRLERRRFLAIWARSLLGRYVPGNVLMVAGRVVLGKEAGVAPRVTLAATVYEQMLHLGATGAGAIILVALYGAQTGGAALWLLAVLPFGLALLHPRVLRPGSTWLLVRLGREPLAIFLPLRQLIVLFGWYLANAALLALGVWLIVRSATGPQAGGPLYVGLSFLLSFVLSMLAFVFPSGLGVREGAFAVALARNLPTSVSIAVSAGVRLVLTAAELVFVGLAVLIDRRSRRPVSER